MSEVIVLPDSSDRCAALYEIFQSVNVRGGGDRVVRGIDNQREVSHGLCGLDSRCIGYVKNVFVLHLEPCSQEIARRIPEVDVKDNWDDRPRVL